MFRNCQGSDGDPGLAQFFDRAFSGTSRTTRRVGGNSLQGSIDNPLDRLSVGPSRTLTVGCILGDARSYKEKDSDIIERFPDGRERVRFKTVPAKDTPRAMHDIVKLWNQGMEERKVPRPVLLDAWNLDFLCIHPFRDGNGRVSRLLVLLQSYHLGYEVGRYISIERHIEQNKDRYYETLEQNSKSWHETKHNPRPYIHFILFTLKEAYKELEEQVGQFKSHRGTKTELVLAAIAGLNDDFSIRDIQAKCPAASVDMIRKVLKKERDARTVECLGRGRDAKWHRIAKKG